MLAIQRINMELLLSDPQDAIASSTKERNLFLSGIGSGKSFTISLLSADYAIHNPEAIQFIGANTYSQLTKSTLKRVFDSWRTNYGWIKDVHYKVDRKPLASWPVIHGGLKSYENTISFNNGALIFTSSLDNYKAIDGSEFAIAFLDETKDTKEEAVKEVIIGRLRQAGLWVGKDNELITNQKEVDARRLKGEIIKGFNPLYIFTSPAKVPWLNEWFGLQEDYDEIEAHLYDDDKFFLKETERQCVVISSTFHNKHNLSDGYIESLMDDFKGSPHLVDMLIYGSPIAKTGGEFYHAYERSKHVKQCYYKPELPLHITFDFNVKPYITSLVWQIEMVENRYKVRCIKSFCLKAPKNNAEDLSETIRDYYSDHMEGIFLYGDATGKNTSSVTREFKHHYQVIKHILVKFLHNSSDRVGRYNYPRVKRRDFVNKALAGGYSLDIEIDPSNKELLMDLEFCKEDLDGGKKKDKVTDSLGDTYEKYGHCFVGETLITTLNGQKRIDEIKVGELVLTRNGYRKVLKVFDNGLKDVIKYKIGETFISCTPDHTFFSKYKFVKINDLLVIGSGIFCTFNPKSKQLWLQKLSVTTDANFTDTTTETIIQGGLNSKALLQKSDCIGINTYAKLAKFPKVVIFTTKMKTRLIMMFQTLFVLVQKNTHKYIGKAQRKNTEIAQLINYLITQCQRLRSGTSPMLAGNGIDNTLQTHYFTPPKKEYVNVVELNLLQHSKLKNIAHQFAKENSIQGLTGKKKAISKKDFALFAEMNLKHTNTEMSNAVQENVFQLAQKKQRVYDLQVEGTHEYFANGILVHNCSDAAEYMLCSAFKQWFVKLLYK